MFFDDIRYELNFIKLYFIVKFFHQNRYNKNYTQQEIATRKENVRKSIEGIAKTIINFFKEGIAPTFTVGLNGLSDKVSIQNDNYFENFFFLYLTIEFRKLSKF